MFEKHETLKIIYAVEWYIRDGMASNEEYETILHKLKTLELKQNKIDLEREIQNLQEEVKKLSSK